MEGKIVQDGERVGKNSSLVGKMEFQGRKGASTEEKSKKLGLRGEFDIKRRVRGRECSSEVI